MVSCGNVRPDIHWVVLKIEQYDNSGNYLVELKTKNGLKTLLYFDTWDQISIFKIKKKNRETKLKVH